MPKQENIRQTDALSPAENERLFHWASDVFGAAGTPPTVGLRPETHFVLELNGLAVSHISLLHSEASVGGQTLRLAGLGGVITHADAQGRGCAGRLLRHVIDFYEREWQVDAGFLFCFERFLPFYASLGWQELARPVWIQQPGGPLDHPARAMARPCAGRSWPPGTVQLQTFPW